MAVKRAARPIDEHGFEEGVTVTFDEETAFHRSTQTRQKIRPGVDDDQEPDTVPDEAPPGWAEPDEL